MTDGQHGILVLAETPDGFAELLSQAHRVAAETNMPVRAARFGNAEGAAELGMWGAERVYTLQACQLEQFNVESYTEALAQLATQDHADILMLPGTKRAFELGPRLAARLGGACVSACVDFGVTAEGQMIQARAMIYTGLGTATYRVRRTPVVLIAAPNAFAKTRLDVAPAEVTAFQAVLHAPKMQILETHARVQAGPRLEDAPIVIDVGQGVKKKEDLVLVQQLADALGAQLSCTRPVSSEHGWFPEWLGLSGKKIAPRLCITLGVSGSVQHMVGIRGSGTIVAVNNDPDSAMLVRADYGVVQDLYQFVPAFVQAVQARQVRGVS